MMLALVNHSDSVFMSKERRLLGGNLLVTGILVLGFVRVLYNLKDGYRFHHVFFYPLAFFRYLEGFKRLRQSRPAVSLQNGACTALGCVAHLFLHQMYIQ